MGIGVTNRLPSPVSSRVWTTESPLLCLTLGLTLLSTWLRLVALKVDLSILGLRHLGLGLCLRLGRGLVLLSLLSGLTLSVVANEKKGTDGHVGFGLDPSSKKIEREPFLGLVGSLV